MADGRALVGKTVIVTGATTGIGKETARELARQGARVIIPCRTMERGEAAREDIVNSTGNENVMTKPMDLANLQSVRDFAADFNATEPRLDILINNAGVFAKTRRLTDDGFEMMFGTNHLGHFLLTFLLLDKLTACAPSRIVTVASEAMRNGELNLNDLQFEQGFAAFKGYSRSKAANVMFTVHLAKLLKAQGRGVTCYSLHPGVIQTELGRDYSIAGTCCGKCLLSCCVRMCMCQAPKSRTEGAKTTLYCALNKKLTNKSGRYYSDEKEAPMPSHVTNAARCEKLWEESCKMLGLVYELSETESPTPTPT